VIPITFSSAKPWLSEARANGAPIMKRLLILVAVGLFLGAHGAVGFMSIYPEPALEDGSGLAMMILAP
jgi:hypothetical protein